MRAPVLIANWKMNKTVEEAVRYARDLKGLLEQAGAPGPRVVLSVPFTALRPVAEVIAGGAIGLCAQNVHWEDRGPYTGEVSPLQAKDAGCGLTLIGHSERRQHFAEGNELVNRKLAAALRHGLTPVVCIGESRLERESQKTLRVLEEQLAKGLAGIKTEDIMIAYEPVWAIGTGLTVSPEQAREAHRFIRQKAGALLGGSASSALRVLYGGSVTPANAASLLAEPEVDGLLIGGASLKLEDFSEIIRQAAGSSS